MLYIGVYDKSNWYFFSNMQHVVLSYVAISFAFLINKYDGIIQCTIALSNI